MIWSQPRPSRRVHRRYMRDTAIEPELFHCVNETIGVPQAWLWRIRTSLMRTKLLIAGFMMAVALPATALAQPYDPGCVQQNQDNRAAGTVVGAIGGALIGGAIGGRHNAGAGAVIGGVTGAVAGNAIAGANNHPCPSGYYYSPPPARDDGRYNDGRYNDGRNDD